MTARARRVAAALLVGAAVSSGCAPLRLRPQGPPVQGPSSLRRVADPAEWPDLAPAFAGRDAGLREALDRSLAWFADPKSRAAYPFASPGITHDQARAGVRAFRALLETSADAAEFRARVAREFDLYASVGSDGRGHVLFTGYYSPVFRAARAPTAEYRFPLYAKPPELAFERDGERVVGCRRGGAVVPCPTRADLERDPEALGLAGLEVAWLDSRLDAYLVQVQGSARLALADGGPPLHVGYAGSNGRPYTSIGRLLVEDGKIARGRANLPAIRSYFRDHPGDLDAYLGRNERFVFFRETSPADWPAGALGVPVTPLRTVATDKTIFPRGGVALVQTALATADGRLRPFDQFMLDQDAGGAILAPGRADLYLGIGDEAGEIAGLQSSPGRLSFFVLKPERVAAWARQGADAGGGG